MASALIGSTGFVGGTLLSQAPFDDLYRSTNIGEIEGKAYDLLLCAGAPAAKWKANKEPDADLANLRNLMDRLQKVRAETAILISTVDVYPAPLAVYEDSAVDAEANHPYGRHRYYLERFFTAHFARAVVVRLPALFGQGLRKNFLFDLLRNPDSLGMTHRASAFQFYDMSRLWSDLRRVWESGETLVNLATPPVEAGEVARRCFGVSFDHATAAPPVEYDMRTRHAALFGAAGDYIVSRAETFERIAAFVRRERERAAGA